MFFKNITVWEPPPVLKDEQDLFAGHCRHRTPQSYVEGHIFMHKFLLYLACWEVRT